MALLRRGNTAQPSADDVIPDPREVDPHYAAAAELLAKFSARHDRLTQERRRLTYEIHFVGREKNADSETDRMLRGKLAALRALPPLKPQQATAPDVPSAAIRAGLAVLSGQPISTEPSYPTQLAELDRTLFTLAEAISEQHTVVHRLHDEVCQRIAEGLLPRWNSSLRDVYDCALQLSRAAGRFREFRNAVISAGIRSETLKAPTVHTVALSLGTEDNPASAISEWRRTLQGWNVP